MLANQKPFHYIHVHFNHDESLWPHHEEYTPVDLNLLGKVLLKQYVQLPLFSSYYFPPCTSQRVGKNAVPV